MFRAFILACLLTACGGGGSPDLQAVALLPVPAPAFTEDWGPRTQETGVFGVVFYVPAPATADGADPQTGWLLNNITGRWGSLAYPDVSGLGPNRFWRVDGGQLHFHAGGEDNFALLTRQTFSRRQRITVEADVSLTDGSEGAFAGLALIAGEGDYREIAIRRNVGVDLVKRTAPERETVLASARVGPNTLRIEYDPASGFRYLVNGQLAGTEALDHEGASFASDPGIGLYFSSTALVEGSVGPVRVWTGP